MTTLTYGLQVRNESDAEIIATLKRKGWVENPPPVFDPATQNAPEWNGEQWMVSDKPDAPIGTVAVSMTAMRLALIDAGLGQSVMDAINGIPDETERRIAKAWWQTASTVKRTHPLVNSLATALGQTSDQLDALFAAAKLKDVEVGSE